MSNFKSDKQRKKVMADLNSGNGVSKKGIEIDISISQGLPENKMLSNHDHRRASFIRGQMKNKKKTHDDIAAKLAELKKIIIGAGTSERQFDLSWTAAKKISDKIESLAKDDPEYKWLTFYVREAVNDFDRKSDDSDYETGIDGALDNASYDLSLAVKELEKARRK